MLKTEFFWLCLIAELVGESKIFSIGVHFFDVTILYIIITLYSLPSITGTIAFCILFLNYQVRSLIL